MLPVNENTPLRSGGQAPRRTPWRRVALVATVASIALVSVVLSPGLRAAALMAPELHEDGKSFGGKILDDDVKPVNTADEMEDGARPLPCTDVLQKLYKDGVGFINEARANFQKPALEVVQACKSVSDTLVAPDHGGDEYTITGVVKVAAASAGAITNGPADQPANIATQLLEALGAGGAGDDEFELTFMIVNNHGQEQIEGYPDPKDVLPHKFYANAIAKHNADTVGPTVTPRVDGDKEDEDLAGPDPLCKDKCPVAVCMSEADADKPECAECAKCHAELLGDGGKKSDVAPIPPPQPLTENEVIGMALREKWALNTPQSMGLLFEEDPPMDAVEMADDVAAALPEHYSVIDEAPECKYPVLNQGSCGSCYAFSATVSLAMRRCLYDFRAGKKHTQVPLSQQTMVSCSNADVKQCIARTNGCKGGTLTETWEYLQRYGIDTEADDPYTSGGSDNALEHFDVQAAQPAQCKDTDRSNNIKAAGYYSIAGEKAIMAAILAHGPVDVGIMVTDNLMSWKVSDSWSAVGLRKGGHAVSIYGWGVDKHGDGFWLAQNSWGTSWGTDGYFKIYRGADNDPRVVEIGLQARALGGYVHKDQIKDPAFDASGTATSSACAKVAAQACTSTYAGDFVIDATECASGGRVYYPVDQAATGDVWGSRKCYGQRIGIPGFLNQLSQLPCEDVDAGDAFNRVAIIPSKTVSFTLQDVPSVSYTTTTTTRAPKGVAAKVVHAASAAGCFPADSIVERLNTATGAPEAVRIGALQLGDRVRTVGADGEPAFTPVVAWLHHDAGAAAAPEQFLRVELASGEVVKATAGHLVQLASGAFVRAAALKSGDALTLASGGAGEVAFVSAFGAHGVYAPATAAGTLVVDGVLASCYAEFYDHGLAHAAMAPLRWLHGASPRLARYLSPSAESAQAVHGYAAAFQRVVSFVAPRTLDYEVVVVQQK